MFPHYHINGTIFENVDHKTRVVTFSATSLNVPHYNKNLARCDPKCIYVFMQSTRYYCTILMKLEDSQHILEDYSNMKYDENPFSGRRIVPGGRTNRHDEANSRFLRYFAKAPKNMYWICAKHLP
jgi:hypothetical protein